MSQVRTGQIFYISVDEQMSAYIHIQKKFWKAREDDRSNIHRVKPPYNWVSAKGE